MEMPFLTEYANKQIKFWKKTVFNVKEATTRKIIRKIRLAGTFDYDVIVVKVSARLINKLS